MSSMSARVSGPTPTPDKGSSRERLVLTDHMMWADNQVGLNQ
jgi:hypothetical protein